MTLGIKQRSFASTGSSFSAQNWETGGENSRLNPEKNLSLDAGARTVLISAAVLVRDHDELARICQKGVIRCRSSM